MSSEEQALELFKDAAEIIPVMGDIAEFAIKLNEFVNRPGGDPMLRTLGEVHNQLAALNDAILASWVTAREDNLAFLAAHSSASLITANNYLQSGSPSGDMEWEAKKAIADRDSLIAVQTLIGDMNGGYWLRPQSNRAISQMGDPTQWMYWLADRAEVDAFNRVWDHRWALPATIYAITTRVAVLKAFSAPASVLKPEVQRYLDFLTPVIQKMESGVRIKQSLTQHEIDTTVIVQGRAPVVAVDIYGGYFIHHVFSFQFYPHEFEGYPYYPGIVPPLLSPEPDKMLKNIVTIGEYWQSVVRLQIGWGELLRIWGQLENLKSGQILVPNLVGAEQSDIHQVMQNAAGWDAPIQEIVNYLLLGEDQPVPNLSRNVMAFVIRAQRREFTLGNIFQQPSAQEVHLVVSAHNPPAGTPVEPGATVSLQFAEVPR